MKILTLLGSPRADGITERILGWVEEALKKQGHRTQRIHLGALDIRGCRSCFACLESPDEPGCVLQDDALGVFQSMIEADGILFATPLYMWSYSAQLKALFDRSLCLVRGYMSPNHQSFVEGKRAALLVSCGGPIDGNADAIGMIYPRFAKFAKLDSRGVHIFPHCTEPSNLPNTHGNRVHDLAGALAE